MFDLLPKSLAEQYVLTIGRNKETPGEHRGSDASTVMAVSPSKSTGSAKSSKSNLRHLDPDTDYKVRRIVSKVNECVHLVANEPSLGLYRIQEHVHRTLPALVSRKRDMMTSSQELEGTLYDLDLSLEVVNSLGRLPHFTRIEAALSRAIETKRKLNEREESLRMAQEHEMQKAAFANRSISNSEPAEGYICPVCYFALTSQDQLIVHWQAEHNLADAETDDIFQEVDIPTSDSSFHAAACDGPTLSSSLLSGISFCECQDDRELAVINISQSTATTQMENTDATPPAVPPRVDAPPALPVRVDEPAFGGIIPPEEVRGSEYSRTTSCGGLSEGEEER